MRVECTQAILFFYGVLRVGISRAKFAPQVVKFCCYSVGVGNCVSKMEGDELECLLYYEWGDTDFNHRDVWRGDSPLSTPRPSWTRTCSPRGYKK